MTQSTQVQREGVAQVAGRILIAWRNGENGDLRQELERARYFASQAPYIGKFEMASTLEMERLEVLSGVVEALRSGYSERSGAARLLEHLATTRAPRVISE
jgi:hypothetical protein